MSDILRITAFCSAVVGQLPVKDIHANILEFKLLSPFGFWCIILFLLNILIGQSFMVVISLLAPIVSQNDSELNSSILNFMSILNINFVYLVYLLYLSSVPKFLKTCEQLSIYDNRFGIIVQYSKWRILGKIMVLGAWIFEGGISLVSVIANFNMLELNSDLFTSLNKWSLIFGILGSQNIEMQVFYWVAALHFLITRFGTIFATQYIITLSQCLQDRMDIIEKSIVFKAKSPNPKAVIVVVQSKTYKINTETTITQVFALNKVFEMLQGAASRIILAYMSVSTVVVTILIFNTFSTLRQFLNSTNFYTFALLGIAYLIISILKLCWLADSGDSLFQKVSMKERDERKTHENNLYAAN